MKLLLFALLLTSSIFAFAADGSSGCGPGWYILKENSILSSSLRATTNGILFPSTTIGMTIGTSNCSKHKLVLKEKESLHYAVNNYFELKSELAMGAGDYAQGFAEVIGCSPLANERFSTKLKKNYKKIFNHDGVRPEELLKEVYNVILTDEKLAWHCSLS
jgi:hypothetical protein